MAEWSGCIAVYSLIRPVWSRCRALCCGLMSKFSLPISVLVRPLRNQPGREAVRVLYVRGTALMMTANLSSSVSAVLRPVMIDCTVVNNLTISSSVYFWELTLWYSSDGK
jgi:hypothetical protein